MIFEYKKYLPFKIVSPDLTICCASAGKRSDAIKSRRTASIYGGIAITENSWQKKIRYFYLAQGKRTSFCVHRRS